MHNCLFQFILFEEKQILSKAKSIELLYLIDPTGPTMASLHPKLFVHKVKQYKFLRNFGSHPQTGLTCQLEACNSASDHVPSLDFVLMACGKYQIMQPSALDLPPLLPVFLFVVCFGYQ